MRKPYVFLKRMLNVRLKARSHKRADQPLFSPALKKWTDQQ